MIIKQVKDKVCRHHRVMCCRAPSVNETCLDLIQLRSPVDDTRRPLQLQTHETQYVWPSSAALPGTVRISVVPTRATKRGHIRGNGLCWVIGLTCKVHSLFPESSRQGSYPANHQNKKPWQHHRGNIKCTFCMCMVNCAQASRRKHHPIVE